LVKPAKLSDLGEIKLRIFLVEILTFAPEISVVKLILALEMAFAKLTAVVAEFIPISNSKSWGEAATAVNVLPLIIIVSPGDNSALLIVIRCLNAVINAHRSEVTRLFGLI